MFVVMEWRRAAGLPEVADDQVHASEEEAREAARWYHGRRTHPGDRYTVHEVKDEPRWEASS